METDFTELIGRYGWYNS